MVKAAQCWVSCGLDPSAATNVLLSYTTSECDASLRNTALDTISQIQSNLDTTEFLKVYSHLCHSVNPEK